MKFTKLNHLLSPSLARGSCRVGDHPQKQHYWVACGDVRSTTGANIVLYLRCRYCDARETVFLTNNEYEIQERIINSSIREQQEIR